MASFPQPPTRIKLRRDAIIHAIAFHDDMYAVGDDEALTVVDARTDHSIRRFEDMGTVLSVCFVGDRVAAGTLRGVVALEAHRPWLRRVWYLDPQVQYEEGSSVASELRSEQEAFVAKLACALVHCSFSSEVHRASSRSKFFCRRPSYLAFWLCTFLMRSSYSSPATFVMKRSASLWKLSESLGGMIGLAVPLYL